jgi:hypothetical protein
LNKVNQDVKFYLKRFPAKTRLLMVLMAGVLVLVSSGCGASGGERVKLKALELAPLEEMPDYVQSAPRDVQEAYRFAVANPNLLQQIPCFCGCNSIGHMNNLDCYVDEFGQITEFDNHAAY